MIVVIGHAAFRPDSAGPGRGVGLAPGIATAAAGAGAAVELLSRIGDDGAGEELLLALARARVGHLAVLRDPARPTALARVAADVSIVEEDELSPAALLEPSAADGPPGGDGRAVPPGPALEPADLSLGLRYLRDYRVVVAVEPLADGSAAAIAEAAAFAGAALVVVAAQGLEPPAPYATATVLEAPVDDAGGAFAALVGRYAAALDRDVAPAEAFRAAASEGGWEPAGA